jgi:flagellar basal body P-ring formation protein FlgA
MLLRLLSCSALTIGMAGVAAICCRAADLQDPAMIRAAVQSAAAAQIAIARSGNVEIEVGEIDSRLHFPACPALDVAVPTVDAAALTARVSCAQPPWTLYVPVHIRAWGQAVVAATNLAPNTKLSATDLTLARVDVFTTNGAYLTDPSQAEGKILRANIRAGSPIMTSLLDLPVIVRRGQSVLLSLSDSAINIKTNVVAMEDGRAGDSILVQNPDSKKTVRATISDAGTVEMHFGAPQ